MGKRARAQADAGREGAQRGANTGGISSAHNEIHVLVTSNGSPYLNFQTRIMYGTYKKVRDLPGSELRYFTRLLHRSDDDILMGEVPTVRVDPLTPKCDQWCEFPVSDRPDAVAKWLPAGWKSTPEIQSRCPSPDMTRSQFGTDHNFHVASSDTVARIGL